MSGFSADWLALREPADARARSAALVASPVDSLVGAFVGGFLGGLVGGFAGNRAQPFPVTLDLGAGTGANLRWLAPRLGFGQRWCLIDNDAALLATARHTLADWARQSGYRLREPQDGLEIAAEDFDCAVAFRTLDLGSGLDELGLERGSLVTASALLDLVSEAWLDGLVGQIAATDSSALFALSYDGGIELEPAATDDAAIVALVNRHQRTDKGFGPALGPDAWRVARERLERAGLEVRSAETSWHCSADDRDLVAELVDGWAAAAATVDPSAKPRIAAWHDERQRQAEAGQLRVRVGHRDLIAMPHRT